MYYNDWAPYVPVAKRRADAAKAMKKKFKGNAKPVAIEGRKIAKTFWGAAWCENLESYSDFSNRMPRGRTYVCNGSVVHLEIAKGKVEAYVAGSELYSVKIEITQAKSAAWREIKSKCVGEIGSLVELLQGKLSKNTLAIITDAKSGLFPSPHEIKLSCSCPDWAVMCKHVAAALYGVGARLDDNPELFFLLRGVDHLELIETSAAIPSGARDGETLDPSSLGDIFGVELSEGLDKAAPEAADDDGKRKRPSAAKLPAAKRGEKTAKTKAKKAVKKAAKKVAKKAVKKAAKKRAVKKRPAADSQ